MAEDTENTQTGGDKKRRRSPEDQTSSIDPYEILGAQPIQDLKNTLMKSMTIDDIKDLGIVIRKVQKKQD